MRGVFLGLPLIVFAAACSSGGGGVPPIAQTLPGALQNGTFQAMAIGYDGTSQSATVTTEARGLNFRLTVDNIFDETLALPPFGSTFSGKLRKSPLANESFSYLRFGEWNSTATLVPSNVGGFFVFGSTTPGPGIPTSGSATFRGSWLGMSGSGSVLDPFDIVIEGSITGTASFASRTLNLSAQDTAGAPRFTGSLSYAAGVNSLTGSVSSSTSGATGSARAQFFGPGAEELGGTFNIPATPNSRSLSGAFGMKR
jgi:hypothetical protein